MGLADVLEEADVPGRLAIRGEERGRIGRLLGGVADEMLDEHPARKRAAAQPGVGRLGEVGIGEGGDPVAERVGLRRVLGLGALAGTTMLARNDAFFLCGALLAAVLFFGRRQRPVRDVAIIVAGGAGWPPGAISSSVCASCIHAFAAFDGTRSGERNA